MQDRRSLLSMFWAGLFPGWALATGKVSAIKADDGPTLYVFSTHPELGGDVVIDGKLLQEAWAKAWSGHTVPPLMAVIGGDIHTINKQLCSIRHRIGDIEGEVVARTPEEAKELWDSMFGEPKVS